MANFRRFEYRYRRVLAFSSHIAELTWQQIFFTSLYSIETEWFLWRVCRNDGVFFDAAMVNRIGFGTMKVFLGTVISMRFGEFVSKLKFLANLKLVTLEKTRGHGTQNYVISID